MAVLDDLARDLASRYGLQESSISELRAALSTDVNLATLLRRKTEEDDLTLMQASVLVRAGFKIPIAMQYLDVWDKGLFSDDSLNQVMREAIAENADKDGEAKRG